MDPTVRFLRSGGSSSGEPVVRVLGSNGPSFLLMSGLGSGVWGSEGSVFGDPAVRFCEIQRFLCFGIWRSGILRSSGPCSGIQRSVLLYTAGHSSRTSFWINFPCGIFAER